MISQPAYHHTQRAPLCLLLYVLAIAEFVLAWALRDQPVMPWLFLVVGASLLVLAASFHYLEVSDQGDRLSVSFGPIRLFRKTLTYSNIISVELGRTTLLDGWGIHWLLGRGWLWNIWGRDCVVLQLKKGMLRIGSDDAEGLARFLRGRIG